MKKAARRNRQAGHVGNKVGKEGILVRQRERVEAREVEPSMLCWECGAIVPAGTWCRRCLP